MTTTQWIMIGAAVALAIIAGLLAAVEAALRTFTMARAQSLVDEERPGAARIMDYAEDPAPTLNTALFLRLVSEIGTTALVAIVVFAHAQSWWLRLLVLVSIMVLVSFIAWGVAPRTLGRQHAVAVARAASVPLAPLTLVFTPLVQGLILIGNAITPGRGFADGPWATEAELRAMVDLAESADVIEADERRMIHSVFDFGDTLAKEVMVPRTDMVSIEEHKTLRQALSLSLRSGFSRIPVVGTDADDVVGVLYLKDVIRRVYDNASAESSEQVTAVMRPAEWCPDSKPIDELLQEMQRSHTHLVMVGDEFGGTAGLISLEDILEEIVGEIVDEYDNEQPLVVELSEGRLRVSSRLPVDDLGELFGLRVDDEDVDTVGGLMAKELSMVPIAGSVVHWEGLELTAERASGRRNQQRTVLVTRKQKGPGDGVRAVENITVESSERSDAAKVDM